MDMSIIRRLIEENRPKEASTLLKAISDARWLRHVTWDDIPPRFDKILDQAGVAQEVWTDIIDHAEMLRKRDPKTFRFYEKLHLASYDNDMITALIYAIKEGYGLKSGHFKDFIEHLLSSWPTSGRKVPDAIFLTLHTGLKEDSEDYVTLIGDNQKRLAPNLRKDHAKLLLGNIKTLGKNPRLQPLIGELFNAAYHVFYYLEIDPHWGSFSIFKGWKNYEQRGFIKDFKGYIEYTSDMDSNIVMQQAFATFRTPARRTPFSDGPIDISYYRGPAVDWIDGASFHDVEGHNRIDDLLRKACTPDGKSRQKAIPPKPFQGNLKNKRATFILISSPKKRTWSVDEIKSEMALRGSRIDEILATYTWKVS